jgi:phenylacetate-CoA ligase
MTQDVVDRVETPLNSMSVVHQRYLEMLRRSQFAPPGQLATRQVELLERLVRHAYENVPYYRGRLACLLGKGGFRAEAWHEVPIITRADIQERTQELHALTVPRSVGASIRGTTSGTTGTPLAFSQSHLAIIASECQWERMLEFHGIDRSAHLARIRGDQLAPYPLGRESVGWNLTCPTARQSSLHAGTPIAEQAEWLVNRAPNYLMTYPSNAAALAQRLAAIDTSLALKGVLTLGEQVTDEHREAIAQSFGCRAFDTYGGTEVGYLAFECPVGGGYHLAYESALVEITDEDGMPARAGSLGRVVVTALYNYAMPFIRYAIGDYAVAAAADHCRCGRTLPRVVSIAGRARNVFTFIDGSQQSPWGWRSAFHPLIPARQMQIVQTAMDAIEIRYVPRDEAPTIDATLIEEAGRRRIHPTVRIRAIAVSDIPRLPSGKIEDCISLVTPSLRKQSVS